MTTRPEFRTAFGTSLAREIRKTRVRPRAIASAAGISSSTLDRFIAGQQLPTLQELNKLVSALTLNGVRTDPKDLLEKWREVQEQPLRSEDGGRPGIHVRPAPAKTAKAKAKPRVQAAAPDRRAWRVRPDALLHETDVTDVFPASPGSRRQAEQPVQRVRIAKWSTLAAPKPVRVKSVAEFIEALRKVHVWAGKPSYRAIAVQSGNLVPRSTVADLFHEKNQDKLPKLELVMDLLATYGVEDTGPWHHAWTRLARTTSGA